MADSAPPDQGDPAPEKPKGKWRQALLTIGGVIAYMIPLFWLWSSVGWPESFGITITAHGKAGLLENWYYSYLLVERPSLIDDVTYLYMWAPIAGLIGWFGWKQYRSRAGRGGGGMSL